MDCEQLFGRILDNWNVISSVDGTSKASTEEIWTRMFPNEPYELKMSSHNVMDVNENNLGASESTKYDLVSAVKRQSPFFYQVMKKFVRLMMLQDNMGKIHLDSLFNTEPLCFSSSSNLNRHIMA